MNYEERLAALEAEVAALKAALMRLVPTYDRNIGF